MGNTRSRIRAVGILTLAGTPSYVLCFLWHICMDGHMQHGPYPLYQWISDYWWMACFASVLVFSLRMNAKERALFWAGSTFLILSRIGGGSGGGGNVLIELPLLIAVDIYSIKYVIRPERFERHGCHQYRESHHSSLEKLASGAVTWENRAGHGDDPLKGRKMNWDRGFRLIMLLLSFIGAVMGAGLLYYDSMQMVKSTEFFLAMLRRHEYTEGIDDMTLVNEWRRWRTFDKQCGLWTKWTGMTLGSDPSPEDNLQPPTEEELLRLKRQGWETVKGEPLPLTPKGVWLVKHPRDIARREQEVRKYRSEVPIATVKGAGLGFVVVWGLYALARLGARLLLIREDEHKDGQQGNGTG